MSQKWKRYILWVPMLAIIAGVACSRAVSSQSRKAAIPPAFTADGFPPAAYDNRSITSASISALTHSSASAAADLTLYRRYVDRSLLVRNPAVTDDATQMWFFPTLIQRVFQTLKLPAGSSPDPAGDAVRYWVDNVLDSNLSTRWNTLDPARPLNTIPLRLLAVVNRVDLARSGNSGCPAAMYCGAEFRFVYAGITETESNPPDPLLVHPYFSLIFEFALPKLSGYDLQKLAVAWDSLADTSVTDTAYPGALETELAALYAQWAQGLRADGQLATPADSQVRIRVNAITNEDGPWHMAQFAVSAAGIIQVPLDQQFSDSFPLNQCVSSSTAKKYKLDTILAAPGRIVAADYNFFMPGTNCKDVTLTGDLASCRATIESNDASVLTLDKGVVSPTAPASPDELRYALSINSCTGCHNLETQGLGWDPLQGNPPHGNPYDESSHFDQIRYRETNSVSTLSRFLTGADDGEPSVSFWPVTTPLAGSCVPQPPNRGFNDLLRRALYTFFLSHPSLGIPILPIPVPAPTSAQRLRDTESRLHDIATLGWNAHQSH